MSGSNDNLEKRREIVFCALHPDQRQAQTAVAMLSEIDGIRRVEAVDDLQIVVRYHLLTICLADIEQLLEGNGFHIDNRLFYKIRRALFHYTEETQRANLGCARGESNCTEKVFVNRYRKREHGCQDGRPDPWRRYL